MSTIKQTLGPTSSPLQNLTAAPKPPLDEKKETSPLLSGDESTIKARPESLTTADLVAKAKAAQTGEIGKLEETEVPVSSVSPPPPTRTPPPRPVAAPTLPPKVIPPKTVAPQTPPAPRERPVLPPSREEIEQKMHAQLALEKNEADKHIVKQVLDGVGTADNVKEGLKVASEINQIAQTPLAARMLSRLPSLSTWLTSVSNSSVVNSLTRVLGLPIVKPALKGLGRVAPVAGVGVAAFDIYSTAKTVQDPKASTAKKVVSVTKSVMSSVGATAGVAALFLAPTGVGGAVAGGIALGAGVIAFGCDFAIGRMN
ncbi:MAG TPA: hypothetical protein DD435_17505 [Cyanobacteria bacterium UBA8530]|nr:hypothetical protein [Cyanobacteria bacterium UBA8530]